MRVAVVGATGAVGGVMRRLLRERSFPADEVVLFTHPESERNWLEEGLVDQAKDRFEPPVRHVVVE